jgi:hypothetical protein
MEIETKKLDTIYPAPSSNDQQPVRPSIWGRNNIVDVGERIELQTNRKYHPQQPKIACGTLRIKEWSIVTLFDL